MRILLSRQSPWWLAQQASTEDRSQADRKTQKVRGGQTCRSDYVLEADSVAPAAKLAVYPADLNQSGNLRRHPSQPEQPLEKNRLLRSPGGKQTEAAVGDVLHSSTEDRRFFLGRKRRQFGSLEFSPDGIARIPSFWPRLLRITPRKDLQNAPRTEESLKKIKNVRGRRTLPCCNLSKLQDFRQNPGPIRSSALEHDRP